MTRHHFFIPAESITDNLVTFPKDIAHQISKVLRLKVGEEVIVLDNSGKQYLINLSEIQKDFAIGNILKTEVIDNEPKLKIILYQSLIAKDKFELVLQKCTELGVTKFVPLITERTQFKEVKLDRLKNIIQEAAEQSERTRLPQIEKSQDLADVLNSLDQKNTLIALERLTGNSSSEILPKFQNLNEINIIIGPEGGFSEAEIKLIRDKEFQTISLGKRILRSETAAIVLSGILLLA